jgi:transcriptional regulator with XRE-family HTH domain
MKNQKIEKFEFSGSHCRAARGFLNWSQEELAKKAGTAKQTIINFESGKREPYERTLKNIRAALENGDKKGSVSFNKEGCVCFHQTDAKKTKKAKK